ncbi:hypothetical protein BGZ94_001063 [Podila epigama]|nr:hypothetical protein BGZ94_001063 [Podila epigama]
MTLQDSHSHQENASSAHATVAAVPPPAIPSQRNEPSARFTNGLLVASGTAFLTGIFGSLWYQGRQDKRKGLNRIAPSTSSAGPGLQSLNDLKVAESLIREGRMLGLKAFGIATTLCLSGAFLIVGTTRWALDINTIPEFSAKMRDLFPKQKTKFVDAVVGADQSIFGGSDKTTYPLSDEHNTTTTHADEKDLDHEDDVNLLGRIERELRKLEQEDQDSRNASTSSA